MPLGIEQQVHVNLTVEAELDADIVLNITADDGGSIIDNLDGDGSNFVFNGQPDDKNEWSD